MTDPTLKQAILQVLGGTEYLGNPYLATLRDGALSKEEFVETQIQFYSAVVFFSRPMAALAAKIPDPSLRVEILRNVWEEHGEGDPSRVHGTTFLEFLRRLDGIGPEAVARRTLWPEVRAFNTALAGACVLDEYLVGAAMLGMIERMFCDISAAIGRAVVARGWMRAEDMIHYDLHEKLDVKHSEDFFDVLEPAWRSDVSHRYYIEQGLRMGASVFNGLYTGLYEGRARRWMRDDSGPHSRA